jgi:hypothetical protein
MLILLGVTSLAIAQVDTAWVRRYNGPISGRDAAYSIAVDSAGYVYVSGESDTTGFTDFVTIKYTPSGDIVWAKRFRDSRPGSYRSFNPKVQVDRWGDVYVTGQSGAIDLDYCTIKYSPVGETLWVRFLPEGDSPLALSVDSIGNVYVTGMGDNASGGNFLTVKYSPLGDTLWVRRYDGPDHRQDGANALVLDRQGNVYVSGKSYSLMTSYDYCVIKYTADGQELWVRKYNGPGNFQDYACGSGVDTAGYFYVTGLCSDPSSLEDACTIKYTPDGDTVWVRRYNGPANSYDWGKYLAIDRSGNIVVSGMSYGVGTGKDYVTIKYTPAGDTLWVRRYNGPPGDQWDDVNGVAVDSARNVYVTGVSFGIGTDYDYATLKYDRNGDSQWVMRYNGPTNGGDGATDLVVVPGGDVCVTGGSDGLGTGSDYCTIKYHSLSGVEVWESVKLLRDDRLDLKVQNPASRMGEMTYYLPREGEVAVDLYDCLGRRVRRLVAERAGEGWHKAKALVEVPAGLYFVHLAAQGDEVVKRMVVVK